MDGRVVPAADGESSPDRVEVRPLTRAERRARARAAAAAAPRPFGADFGVLPDARAWFAFRTAERAEKEAGS